MLSYPPITEWVVPEVVDETTKVVMPAVPPVLTALPARLVPFGRVGMTDRWVADAAVDMWCLLFTDSVSYASFVPVGTVSATPGIGAIKCRVMLSVRYARVTEGPGFLP